MPATDNKDRVAVGFRHTGIVVRDMDKSLWFYRDLLGLEPVVDCLEEGPFIERLTAVPGARVRIVKLQVEADGIKKGGMIELLQFLDPVSQKDNREQSPLHISHVAFSVPQVDRVFEAWSKKGVHFNHSPQISPDGYAKVAYCHDPDGTTVELVQVLKP